MFFGSLLSCVDRNRQTTEKHLVLDHVEAGSLPSVCRASTAFQDPRTAGLADTNVVVRPLL
jgi:hypothetical protein